MSIEWKDHKEGMGRFAIHLADSRLKCSCGNAVFSVKATEEGGIYVICTSCGDTKTIKY